jgi:hypothetical protein
MEFDELQKVWDGQNKRSLYVINESALHKRVLSKKNRASATINITEWLIIITNLAAGTFILGIDILKDKEGISLYLLSAWMILTAMYTLISRVRRMKGDNQFDRSMLSDLHYAIRAATYQVRISQLMRWNIFPIGIFVLLSVWEGGKSVWLAVGIFIFFVFTHVASGWEHNIYKNRKRELEILKEKLEEE